LVLASDKEYFYTGRDGRYFKVLDVEETGARVSITETSIRKQYRLREAEIPGGRVCKLEVGH
jgi:hypothetical protein